MIPNQSRSRRELRTVRYQACVWEYSKSRWRPRHDDATSQDEFGSHNGLPQFLDGGFSADGRARDVNSSRDRFATFTFDAVCHRLL